MKKIIVLALFFLITSLTAMEKSTREQLITNAYETLELNTTATLKDIKDAYKKLALKWHPDRYEMRSEEYKNMSKENFENKFKEISNAYKLLENKFTGSLSVEDLGEAFASKAKGTPFAALPKDILLELRDLIVLIAYADLSKERNNIIKQLDNIDKILPNQFAQDIILCIKEFLEGKENLDSYPKTFTQFNINMDSYHRSELDSTEYQKTLDRYFGSLESLSEKDTQEDILNRFLPYTKTEFRNNLIGQIKEGFSYLNAEEQIPLLKNIIDIRVRWGENFTIDKEKNKDFNNLVTSLVFWSINEDYAMPAASLLTLLANELQKTAHVIKQKEDKKIFDIEFKYNKFRHTLIKDLLNNFANRINTKKKDINNKTIIDYAIELNNPDILQAFGIKKTEIKTSLTDLYQHFQHLTTQLNQLHILLK